MIHHDGRRDEPVVGSVVGAEHVSGVAVAVACLVISPCGLVAVVVDYGEMGEVRLVVERLGVRSFESVAEGLVAAQRLLARHPLVIRLHAVGIGSQRAARNLVRVACRRKVLGNDLGVGIAHHFVAYLPEVCTVLACRHGIPRQTDVALFADGEGEVRGDFGRVVAHVLRDTCRRTVAGGVGNGDVDEFHAVGVKRDRLRNVGSGRAVAGLERRGTLGDGV